MQKIPPPEPGIYFDIPFETYQSWNALNASTLVWSRCSMEHVKAHVEGVIEDKDTPAKAFGRALHCRVLEPQLFEQKYVVTPGCEAILKQGKNKGNECGATASFAVEVDDAGNTGYFCGKHAPLGSESPDNLITVDQKEKLDAINHKLRNHPVIKLIRQHGGFECCIVWERDGIMCKCRLDKYLFDAACPNTIVDLKKVQLGKAGDDEFERSIVNYQYAMRSAWYIDAARCLHGIEPAFIWIVVEDAPPYGINVVHCNQDTYKVGKYLCDSAFETYRLCVEKDEWPGYCNDIHLGGAPQWYLRQFQGIIDVGE